MFLVLILQYGGTSVHRILSLSLLSFLFYEECAYLIFVISLNFCVKYVYMSKKLFLINAVFLVLILQYGGKHMHRILSLFYFLLNEECFPFLCVFLIFFVKYVKNMFLNPSMFLVLILQYGGTAVHRILSLSSL